MGATAQQRRVNIPSVLKAENFRQDEWQQVVSHWHPLFRNIASIVVSTPAEQRGDVRKLLMVINAGEDEVNESAAQFALDLASLSEDSLLRLGRALLRHKDTASN